MSLNYYYLKNVAFVSEKFPLNIIADSLKLSFVLFLIINNKRRGVPKKKNAISKSLVNSNATIAFDYFNRSHITLAKSGPNVISKNFAINLHKTGFKHTDWIKN